MIAKFVPIALILAMAAGCATDDGNEGPGPGSEGSPLAVNVSKNQNYLMPLDNGEINGGYLLRVELKVPSGRIFAVDYGCDGGDECAHVHECPSADRCGPDHLYRVTYDGNKATWWGWTDSGMVKDAQLKFKVHFTGAESPSPPC